MNTEDNHSMVRIKICGMTNREDAERAVELGANALGFIFAPSPRQVSPEEVRCMVEALPPFVQTVGVFVDEKMSDIRRIMKHCGLDLVQLQGDESPGFCRELMPDAVKSFRLKDETGLLPIKDYKGTVRAIHLDSYRKGTKGGTGEVFDWTLAVRAKALDIPLILSGGLGPLNIENAISAVRPYAVDINSGIEDRPGRKDHALMKQLIEKVKKMNFGGV